MVIGITGRMGSGKTAVAGIFEKNGFTLVDADGMGHNLLEREDIKKKIRETFGDSPFKRGKIDRKKLGDILFKDGENLHVFNSFVHPPLIRELTNTIEKRRNTTHLVVDCALIFEWGIEKLFDYIVLVECSDERIIERMTKAGRTEDEVRRILSVQLADGEKLKRAHFIIENKGDLSELEKKTTEIISSLSRLYR
ncbi:dephospho-CoA kinase [candidate division WOR-3 bacterium JGI_Cruoil_03_44_89]|uniref:Dephospho-CoA kinase n=1 Tax=candidate division WOR-3 bacterium JGI_Cruoil_03_44_89 TaxID=1973748 RepID=A0A235BS60_UNCW3|nr:MAG: dephospho-CoA kinase [candidate division WOR-3 bacterium JGI_Cruoil_03_44_89]